MLAAFKVVGRHPLLPGLTAPVRVLAYWHGPQPRINNSVQMSLASTGVEHQGLRQLACVPECYSPGKRLPRGMPSPLSFGFLSVVSLLCRTWAPWVEIPVSSYFASWNCGHYLGPGQGPGELQPAWGTELRGDEVRLLPGCKGFCFLSALNWLGLVDSTGFGARLLQEACGVTLFTWSVFPDVK